jgi:hypothetical protein
MIQLTVLFCRILKLHNFAQSTVVQYRNTAQEFAQRGFRSLGVAVKEEGKDYELLGIMCMFDPPRSDTAAVGAITVAPQLNALMQLLQTIREAKNLGIVSLVLLSFTPCSLAYSTSKCLQEMPSLSQ